MRHLTSRISAGLLAALCLGASDAGAQVQDRTAPAPAGAWRDFSSDGAWRDFSSDGAWCWFGDPRAVRHNGRTYAGWVTGHGDIEVGVLDADHGDVRRFVLHEKFQRDDHDVPSLFFLPDGRLMVFYSGHGGAEMFARVCDRPEELSGWSEERALEIQAVPRTGRSVTYPNPVLLSDEDNAVYLFWRGDNAKPNWARSRDSGATWEHLGTVARRSDAEPGNRPYVKIASNGKDRIHMVFTSGHPRNEPHNSIFYCCYRNGAFYRADGTRIAAIGELPFEPSQADTVYDASATGARAWVWDIAFDEAGNPVIVYTRHPKETDHRYHYARWNGEAWEDTELCAAGQWFPETEFGRGEPEPHYSGGLVLDHANPSVVYLSRPVNGVFEIERWSTENGGGAWTSTPITRGSECNNVRPFVVRNHGGAAPRVLWMSNRSYIHYSKFDCALKMDLPRSLPAPSEARRFDFQPLASPCAPGYVPVGSTTEYGAENGYGWVSLPDVERDRLEDTSLDPKHREAFLEGRDATRRPDIIPLGRDLVADSVPRTFRVRVPDASYQVALDLGDPGFAHDWVEVIAEGRLAASGIHTASAEIRRIVIPVDVTGGELDLTFRDRGGDDANWALTSLEIREAPFAPAPPPPSAAMPAQAEATSVPPGHLDVVALLHRVADRQLAQESRRRTDDWTYGALYAGVMALAEISPDAEKYRDAMVDMGREHEWQPGPRMYHADEHCVCQTYLELYLRYLDPDMVRPTQKRFDAVLAQPKDKDLTWGTPGVTDKWSWCDALFMAPPAWLRLYIVTGDRKYLDFMNEGWWNTSAHLYDREEHLYYRDGGFFERREANGQKVFWSRGNGWVFAALARVLQFLPQDHPDRPRYVAQFREMADRIAALQPADGLWRPSLLDPDSYPVQETSGTGFFCYGLGWGIRHRILDRGRFTPVVLRAWYGLAACVQPNGKLTHVQPPAGGPHLFDPRSTDVYGVGAFLLAGSEVVSLLGGHPDRRPYVRYVPERVDDIAWENDRVAFRMYGPALGPSGTVDSGIDVWVKSVLYPVINHRYAAGDYHDDHGEGLDYYSVGTTRGCGGSAVWSGGRMHTPGVWSTHRILENGPERVRFELGYAPIDVEGRTIRQTKTITLPLATNLNRIEDVFEADGDAPLVVALGVAKRAGDGRVVMDKPNGLLAYWEPEQPPHGHTGCAVVADPARIRDMIEADDHYLALVETQPGEPLKYLAGAGWSRGGDFPDAESWERYVRECAAKAQW